METVSSLRDPMPFPPGRPGPASKRKVLSIDGILDHLPDRPVKTTRGRGWGGVTLDLHASAPTYFAATPARDHHLLCYCPRGRGRLVQRRAGAVHDGVISTGMSILAPAGHDSIWEGCAAKSARLRIPTALIAEAAAEIGMRAQATVEIVNVFATNDPLIESYALMLLDEIDHAPHPAQALIFETLSCALAAHLLQRYNAFDLPLRQRHGGLSARMLAQITAYIEDNLDRRISLAELAAIADVSRFHFARLFRSSTGFSPIAYVERSRLRRAQDLLKLGQLPIAELALTVGFSDQSEFTRRFHRHFGTTPAIFAKDHRTVPTCRRQPQPPSNPDQGLSTKPQSARSGPP